MWKNGSTAITRSAALGWKPGISWQACATMLRCVSITPLGSPVVPLEYGSAPRAAPAAAPRGAGGGGGPGGGAVRAGGGRAAVLHQRGERRRAGRLAVD